MMICPFHIMSSHFISFPTIFPSFSHHFPPFSHTFTWFSAAVGFFAFLASGSVAAGGAAALRIPAALGSASRPRLVIWGDLGCSKQC